MVRFSTLPQVTDRRLTIDGPASPGITIDGGGAVQVMQVASAVTLNLKNLTIAHASGVGTNGGGGVYNDGTLRVSSSIFSDNFASYGGGIYNDGTLTVTSSTFAGNTVSALGGGVGGIDNEGAGSASLKNTILAASTTSTGSPASNCGGTITDAGYNISDDNTCDFTATGSLNNTNPGLSSDGLTNNGGPTQTIALVPGSPAIDVIPLADCTDQALPPNRIITDQRGALRPDVGEVYCDIGAYEFQDLAGQPKCIGKSVSTLVQQFGNIRAAALALGFSGVRALLKAIRISCGG